MPNKQDEFINKIIQFIDKIELILAAVIAIGLLMRIGYMPFTGEVLTISITSLSCVYFFAAFGFIKNEYAGPMDNFFNKIIYWGLSIGTIGILFSLQHWPNANTFIIISCVNSAIGAAYIMKSRTDKPGSGIFGNRVLLRLLVIGGLCVAFLLSKGELNL